MLTVTDWLAVKPCTLMLTLALPGTTPVASPVEVTVNTLGSLLCQLACAVTSSVVRLLRVAVALSWAVVPAAKGLMGSMLTLITTALDTVTCTVALWPSSVAVMVAVPGSTLVTNPVLRPTAATRGLLLVQLTLVVTSTLAPLL
ncbi:hypothetical protein D3C78_1495450 [compost metagenome]